jgi:putative membrane protein
MSLDRLFSAADHRAIEAAVREAEARSAGEIVPYAVERSDRYHRALWCAATLGALSVSLAAAVVRSAVEVWGPVAFWIAFPPATGAALGGLAAFLIPWLRRALVPAEVLEARVHERATRAFLEEEVFRTRDRTGILIFLSLFEHRVVILADRGLDGRVTPGQWEEVVLSIASGMRRGQPGPALAEGIRRCASLTAQAPPRPDDRDELPGQLRLGRE